MERIMQKYWKIWWRIMTMSIMADIQYRIDFVTGVFSGFVFMIVQMIFLWMFFSQFGLHDLAGYSLEQMCLVYGIYFVMTSVVFIFIMDNCWKLEWKIYAGTLDLDLIKPIHSFWGVFFKKFLFWAEGPNLLIGLVLVTYLLLRGGFDLSLGQWLAVIILSGQACLLYAVMYMIGSFLVFYVMKFHALNEVMHNFDIICTYPRKIFAKELQMILIFIWPMLLILSPIYEVFSNDCGWYQFFVWGGVNLIFMMIAGLMWQDGLKRYQSAA